MNKKRFFIIIITIFLSILSICLMQYSGIFNYNYIFANQEHLWSEMDCDINLCVDTDNNKVGIGTTSLDNLLNISGDLKLNSGSPITCDSSNAGIIKFYQGDFYFCNGLEWKMINYDQLLSNNDHKKSDCEEVGGKVVLTEGIYQCKISASSCPSGWTATGWYKTEDCTAFIYGDYNHDLAAPTPTGVSCYFAGHEFSKAGTITGYVEACYMYYGHTVSSKYGHCCSLGCMTCGWNYRLAQGACTTQISEIGCY